jgi:hypothetical protein
MESSFKSISTASCFSDPVVKCDHILLVPGSLMWCAAPRLCLFVQMPAVSLLSPAQSIPTRQLYGQRGSLRVSRGGTTGGGIAGSGIILVFPRVTGHLADGAAAAPEGATQILATNATLLGDGVLSSHALAGLDETVYRPPKKEQGPQVLHHRDGNRNFCIEPGRRDFEGNGEDEVGHHQHDHHLEGILGGHALAGRAEPGEGHAGHDLRHADPGAATGTPEGGVAEPGRKAVTQAVLPHSRGGVDAVDSIVFGKGDQEVLALQNSALRLFVRRRQQKVTQREMRKRFRCE